MPDPHMNVVIGAQIEGAREGLKEVEHLIHALVAPISSLRDQFTEIGEIAGLAYLGEKLKDWAEEAAEAAEQSINMGAALGMSGEQFQNLAGALSIVGANADTLVRSFYRLGQSADEALRNRSSEKAFAFKDLGLDPENFRNILNGVDGVDKAIDILADKYKALAESGGNVSSSGPFGVLLGPRGFAEFIKALRGGSEGLAELRQKWAETNPLQQKGIEELDTLAEKFHLLWGAIKQFSASISDSISGPLGDFLDWTTKVIANMSKIIQLGHEGKPTGVWEIDHPSGEPGTYSGGGAVSVQEQMAGWLAAHGYVGNAAAAIMGNASAESSYNPAARGPGGSFGLFQWEPSRATPLGGSTDVAKQMELMDQELTKLDPAFKNASGSVEELTKRFMDVFERPGIPRLGARVAGAESAAGGGTGGTYEAWLKAKDAYDNYITATEEGGKREIAEVEQQIALAKARGATYEEQKNLYADLDAARQRMMADEDRATQDFRNKRGDAADEVTKKYKDHAAQRIQADTQFITESSRLSRQQVEDELAVQNARIKALNQSEAEELKQVDRRRQLNQISVNDAEQQQVAIVKVYSEMVAEILQEEQNKATGISSIERRITAEQVQQAMQTAQKIQDINDRAEDERLKKAQAINQTIAQDFASTFIQLITGKETFTQAFARLGEQLGQTLVEKMAQAFLSSSLFGSGGFGGMLSNLFPSLFGAGGAAGGGGLFGAGGLIGGLFGKLFGGGGAAADLFTLPVAFARGGIVPSAAGGWVIPSFQSGGILAQLHGGEMVLPRGISEGMQGLIAGGGAGPQINIHAMDTQTGAQFLMRNASSIASSWRDAGLRGGLSPRAISSAGRYP